MSYEVKIKFEMSEEVFQNQRKISEKLTDNKVTDYYELIKRQAIELEENTKLKYVGFVVYKIEEKRSIPSRRI